MVGEGKLDQDSVYTAILIQYASQLAGDNPDPDWMDSIDSIDDVEASWFADGKVPTCPAGTAYTVTNGVCQKHSH